MNSSNLFGPSASGNAVGIQNNGLLDELEQVLEQIEQFLEAMDKNAQQVNATTLQDQPNPDSGNDGPSGVQGSSPHPYSLHPLRQRPRQAIRVRPIKRATAMPRPSQTICAPNAA